MPQVIAFPDKYVKSYPKHPLVPVIGACELELVLAMQFDSDVHFVAYTNDLGCRLSTCLFDEMHADKVAAANARMTCAAFDVDDPVAHDLGGPARPEWWEAERTKLVRFGEAHPDFFAYRSRGGYRLIPGPLAQPHALRSHADEAAWTANYLTWCGYLQRRFDIRADRACKDWTRHYRAPRVVRDGDRQEWESIGDPERLGVWTPDVRADDLVKPKKRDEVHYGAVEPVPIADPTNAYGRARIASAVDYLKKAPLSIKGEGGRTAMFTVCAVLIRRMRLPLDIAADLIAAIYNPRLAEAGTSTWSRDRPGPHGMSIEERLEKARDTGNIPPGLVVDEGTWSRLQLGGVF